jgi:hypothetical protein
MAGNASQNKALEGRDANTGRFVTGNNGGGRKLGSRNKLATEFIDDLHAKWLKHGPDVLERVIRDDPAAFMRTVAQILPKEIDAAVNVNAGSRFDDCETVEDILRGVAEEAGPKAALALAEAFGLAYQSEITGGPKSVESTAPKLGYSQSQLAIEERRPYQSPQARGLAPGRDPPSARSRGTA